MELNELKNQKIVIFSHYSTTGATEELRDWLVSQKIRELVYVAFPFGEATYRPAGRSVKVSLYKNGRLDKEIKSGLSFGRGLIAEYGRDLFYGIYYGWRFGGGTRFFFGGDNLLSLIGLFLKKIGRVKKVIYYMIDYTPRRYQNKFLNFLYYWLDRRVAHHCDLVWPLSARIMEGRFEDKKLDPKKVRWQVVPYGSHAVADDFRNNEPSHLVYFGGIHPKSGSEMFVPLAQELIKRGVDFKFVVVGGCPHLKVLKKEISDNNLESYFKVYGYVDDFKKVLEILCRCGVALAPYPFFDQNNCSFYSDPGKIKVYLGCGLPLVLTSVPPIAGTIEAQGAGLVAQYSAADLADKIMMILKDYDKFRQKAKALGQQYDWPNIFRAAFAEMPADGQ